MYNNDDEERFKVFFITSKVNDEKEILEYYLKKEPGIDSNLEVLYVKALGNEFSICVFCFEFIKIVKENKPYRAIIKLEQSNKKKRFSPSQTFEGSIYFINSRNNFIFDFKFENSHSLFGNSITPPPSKKMSLLEQLKIYLKIVEDILKKEIYHKITLDLIEDCKNILINRKYELDFFLEIFKFCYLFEPMKDLLILFKLEKIKIPPYPIDLNYYSESINYIEENPGFISKFLSNEDKQEKYFKSFYTLLLYFRYNYEKDKIINLISKEDFWVYYKEIIPFNYTFFKDLKIPQGLINEMTKQELLSTRIIEGIIYFLKSFEKILVFINEKNDCIFNLYMNEKKYIKINNFIKPNQKDYEEIISKESIEIILKETEKLVNYELQKKQFVFIENDFLNYYISFYSKKSNNLKYLALIKKIIQLFKKVDKKLDLDFIVNIIHNNELKMIVEGELKNEELLDFIENDDEYFTDKKIYEDIKYRPIEIFYGFDLTNVNEEFYKKWKKVNIFEKYSFIKYECENIMIDKIKHMKDFGKLIKLFNFENEVKICNLISDKYKQLMKTYREDECPNFLEDSSQLIIILGNNSLEESFLKYIQTNFESQELIIKIFLHLTTNYNNISKNIIKYIEGYFLENIGKNNKIFIKGEIINFLLKYSKKQTIDLLNNYIIKEEELYNDEKDNIKFLLLEEIAVKNCFTILNQSQYLQDITFLANTIFNNINNGKIKYNIIEPIYKNHEKQLIFRQKLKILFYFINSPTGYFFLNKSNEHFTSICMKIIENNINSIYEIIEYLTKLDEVLCLFFETKYINDIISIKNLKQEIANGILDIINTKDSSIRKIKIIIPDLEEIFQLKSSAIFLKLFHDNKFHKLFKNHNKNILNETKDNFQIFKNLFKEDWIKRIDKKFHNIIKEIDDEQIEKELIFMKKYFNLCDIDDKKIEELKNQIIMFKNNKHYEISNNCCFTISSLKNEFEKKNDLQLLMEELNNEENTNQKLTKEIKTKINSLINTLLEKEGKIKDLNDKLKNFDTNIVELRKKLSKFPFELNDDEKMISIIFVSIDESIFDSIICKSKDKFSEIEKQIYKMYPEYEGNIAFMNNGIYINKEKNLDENKIYNNSKINIINITPVI